MTPEETIAQELRFELEARLNAYKQERAMLQKATTRIAELDALIAFAETETPTVKIAPRPKPVVVESSSTTPRTK